MSRVFETAFAVPFTLATFAGTALATEIHVPADWPTIQSAVNAAVNGDVVIVAPGTYFAQVDFKGKAITVQSSGGRDVTIIDALGIDGPAVNFPNDAGADGTLDGFTVRNTLNHPGVHSSGSQFNVLNCAFVNNQTSSGAYGGGIRVFSNSNATIAGCLFEDNQAFHGGAVSVYSGSQAAIVDCEFTDNVATGEGGAIMVYNASTANISGCVFQENMAVDIYGGAIWAHSSDLAVSNSTFQDNMAPDGGAVTIREAVAEFVDCLFESNSATDEFGRGGGADMFNANVTFRRCRFMDNEAAYGGGAAFAEGGVAYFYDNLFAGNVSGGLGGAIQSHLSTVDLRNATIVNNLAEGQTGGAIHVFDSFVFVANSIVWGNEPNQFESVVAEYSVVEGGYAGPGIIDLNPGFADEGDGDFRLAPGSPAIDAGYTPYIAGGYPLDLDSNARVMQDPETEDTGVALFGICVDMGAYEFQPEANVCLADVNDDGVLNILDFVTFQGLFKDGCPD